MASDRQSCSLPALIVIAGVEGGGVTCYGERTRAGWRLWVERADQSGMYLDEAAHLPGGSKQYGVVESWDEALDLLDRAGWLRLPAVRVHPEFRERVWEAVQVRLGDSQEDARRLERWRDRCGAEGDRIDAFIHRERTHGPNKRTFNTRLAALPGGTLVAIGSEAYLTAGGGLRRWSFDGYGPLTSRATEMEVEVLTPKSIVITFAAGFKPDIHASANSELVGLSV